MLGSIPLAWLIRLAATLLARGDEFSQTNYFSALADGGPGSLRQAILDAQSSNSPTRIMPAGVSGTITLSNGLPGITGTLWLDLSAITITGGTTRVVMVASNAQCRITGLQLLNVGASAASALESDVAPLVNRGSLILENCLFSQNANRAGLGGAVLNRGSLTVKSCQFLTNTATGSTGTTFLGSLDGLGGAIYQDGPLLEVTDSTFEGNQVHYGFISAGSYPFDGTDFGGMGGGGLYIANGIVSLIRVSFVNNSDNHQMWTPDRGSGFGGAIEVMGGELAATNCTFSRNIVRGKDSNLYSLPGNPVWQTNPPSSCYGGAIYASGLASVLLVHCTLSENQSRGGDQGAARGYGGAIYGSVELKACVVSGNYAEAGSDVYGVTSLGQNVVGNANGIVRPLDDDILSPATPVLNAIQKSADGKSYYSLPVLSVARDIATPSVTEDELFRPRPVGEFSDAGAYEGELLAPSILGEPPEAVLLTPGSAETVSVTASGTRPLNYDLLFGGNVVRSSTEGTFVLTDADSLGVYQIRVSNAAGSAASRPITLTFNNHLSFSRQPVSELVSPGGRADLLASATGSGSITYQWFQNGSPLQDATNSFLRLFDIQSSDLGDYTIQASSATETITSEPAHLKLPTPIYVSNLNDSGAGSLRDAIQTANAQPAETFTIFLTNSGTLSLSSPLDLSGHVTITNTADSLIISGISGGQSKSNFMHIQTNGSAILHNVRIAHFHTTLAHNGGAFWNEGDLTLSRCTLTDCSAAFGGAILNSGSLAVSASTFYNNSAIGADGKSGDGAGGGGAGMAGAIYNARGSAVLTNVTISGNLAKGGSGGQMVINKPRGLGGNATSYSIPEFASGGAGGYSQVFFTDFPFPHFDHDVLAGRPGGFGGGGGGGNSIIFFNGSSLVTNFGVGSLGGFGGGDGPTKVENNSSAPDAKPSQPDPGAGGGAGFGGAIFLESGTLLLTHCTIVSNTAAGGVGYNNGRGIGGGLFVLTGDTHIQNSILGQNTADESADAFGPVTSLGGNLLGSSMSWATNDLISASLGIALSLRRTRSCCPQSAAR